jgi:hypothetical protein
MFDYLSKSYCSYFVLLMVYKAFCFKSSLLQLRRDDIFLQVRSLKLDVKVWDSSVLTMFQSLGNLFANSVWEELLHAATSTSQTDDTPYG